MTVGDTTPPVSACVVNFNGERYLGRSLTALQHARGVEELLVIDGGSTDGSVRLVRECFPAVRLIALPDNRGPSRLRNAGIREARHDIVLFVDNDVYVPPDVAEGLGHALLETGNAVLAVPRLVHDAAPDTVQYDGADAHFVGAQTLLNAERPVAETPTPVRESDTSMVAACFAIDRRKWGDAPPFDERFFLYFEDHDFGFRCRLRGFTIVGVPRIQCLHGTGTAGISLRQVGSYSDVRIRGIIQNRWQVLLKDYQLRTLAVLAPLLLLYEVAQLAIVIRKGWLRHWAASVLWILRHLADLRERRRTVQRARRIPDREILRGGCLPFNSRLAASSGQRGAQRVLDAFASGYWRAAHRLI